MCAVVNRNWSEIAQSASLSNWKEVLAALVTFAGPEDFATLCGTLYVLYVRTYVMCTHRHLYILTYSVYTQCLHTYSMCLYKDMQYALEMCVFYSTANREHIADVVTCTRQQQYNTCNQ